MIDLSELIHYPFFWIDTLVSFSAAYMLYLHLTWFYTAWFAEFNNYSWNGRIAVVCGLIVSGYCLVIYNSLYGEAFNRWLSMIF